MRTFDVTLTVRVTTCDNSVQAIRKISGYPGQDVEVLSLECVEVEFEDEKEDSE